MKGRVDKGRDYASVERQTEITELLRPIIIYKSRVWDLCGSELLESKPTCVLSAGTMGNPTDLPGVIESDGKGNTIWLTMLWRCRIQGEE